MPTKISLHDVVCKILYLIPRQDKKPGQYDRFDYQCLGLGQESMISTSTALTVQVHGDTEDP